MKQRWFQAEKPTDPNKSDEKKSNTEEKTMAPEQASTVETPAVEIKPEPQKEVEIAQPKPPFPVFSPENIRMMNYVKREVKLATTMFSVEKDCRACSSRDRFMNNVIRSLDTFPLENSRNDIIRIFLYYLETIVPCLVVNELQDSEFIFSTTDDSDPNAKITIAMAKIILDRLNSSLNSGSLSLVDLINQLME